jgi:hypothetical protein
LISGASPAQAVQVRQSSLVSAVPAGFTPAINNGRVLAIAAVGGRMVAGGTFTSVSPAGHPGTVEARQHVVAFDAGSGSVDGGFRPTIDGTVNTVVPGPSPNQVYVGGSFNSVDGTSTPLALLNVNTGAAVAGWKPPQINGSVDKVLLSHGRLYVAGSFTEIGHQPRHGLASLAPSTGSLTSYLQVGFVGHHNYRIHCKPQKTDCAKNPVGVTALDVNPAGTRMVVIGNFTKASGLSRDQVAMLDLGRSSGVVDRGWSTQAYSSPCLSESFDSYVRDVVFDPSGHYFVIVATGGKGRNRDHTDSSCDAAARFETSARGHDVRPRWVAYTGSDSLYSVAATGSVVYVGGHERWLNNRLGDDEAGPGAIPRPGLAALSPATGLPYSWNPGRQPRGAGTFALLATSRGLWTGSDTDYIGDEKYLRPKLAFFPLAGGRSLPAERTPALPGRVFEAGGLAAAAAHPDRLGFREFNGAEAGKQESVSTAMPWGSVRGAFTVDGNVVYGKTDGNLYQRSFNGSALGSEVKLDPYHDPTWDNVETGSGQTYRGQLSTFSQEVPRVTSMFFIRGRLYYTLAKDSALHWRWYEPESGAVDNIERRVPGNMSWSDVAGAFAAHHKIYFARRSTGKLMAVHWHRHKPKGHPRVANKATDWASRGLFLLSQQDNPTRQPLAKFFTRCTPKGKCKLTATPWTDPDGGVVKYQWAWGDGQYSRVTRSTSATHQYRTNGHHKITLIVTTTSGAIAYASYTIRVHRPVRRIGFVGTSTAAGHRSTLKLKVPRATKRGNALLLLVAVASPSASPHPLKGWRAVGRTHHHGLTTIVYRRVATRHDAKSRVRLRFPHRVSSSAILAAYRHTSILPIEAKASALSGATRRHRTPTLRRLTKGAWALVYTAQTSKSPTRWHPPHGMHQRRSVSVRHGRIVGGVLADTGRAEHGTFTAGPTRSTKPSKSAAQWTIALAPAFR